MGWRLGQDDEPVDRDAPGDRHIPRRSRLAAGIVVAIPRNIDHAPVRFVGCPIELGHPEVDPGADVRALADLRPVRRYVCCVLDL